MSTCSCKQYAGALNTKLIACHAGQPSEYVARLFKGTPPGYVVADKLATGLTYAVTPWSPPHDSSSSSSQRQPSTSLTLHLHEQLTWHQRGICTDSLGFGARALQREVQLSGEHGKGASACAAGSGIIVIGTVNGSVSVVSFSSPD